nr:MAG TPA: hypothetical protein [Caudoviricetes sp.]
MRSGPPARAKAPPRVRNKYQGRGISPRPAYQEVKPSWLTRRT